MAFANKKKRALNRILRNKLLAPSRENAVGKREKSATVNAAAYSLSANIPTKYNDTYVRAIQRDPQGTFIYWETPKENAADRGIPDRGSAYTSNDNAAQIRKIINAPKPPQTAPLPIPPTTPPPPEITTPPKAPTFDISAQTHTSLNTGAPTQFHTSLNTDAPTQFHTSINTDAPTQFHTSVNADAPTQTHTSVNADATAQFHTSVSTDAAAKPAAQTIPAPSSGVFYNHNADIGKYA